MTPSRPRLFVQRPTRPGEPGVLILPSKEWEGILAAGRSPPRLCAFVRLPGSPWAVEVSDQGVFLGPYDLPVKTPPLRWSLTARRLVVPFPLYAQPWSSGHGPVLVEPPTIRAASALLRSGRLPIPLPHLALQESLPL